MVIHISIIDDDISFSTLVSEQIRCLNFSNDLFLSVSTFASAEAFRKRDILDTDLALIDIELPKTGGIGLAQRIRETSERVIMAFITNHSQYSLEAYGYNVADYILKALNTEQIPIMMHEIKELIKLTEAVLRQRGDAVMILSTDTGCVSMRGSEIIYVETVKKTHRSTVYTDEENIELNLTLEQFVGVADGGHFFRIHRSFIANLDRIRKIGFRTVTMDDGTILPLSRAKRHDLVEEMSLTSDNR